MDHLPLPLASAMPASLHLRWRWRYLSGMALMLGAVAIGISQLLQSTMLQDPRMQGALMGGSMAALATALANAVAFSVPQRIVLFGGIARNGDVLMNPLKRYFADSLFYIYDGKVELMLSALPEDDAGILGAAALTSS